MMGKLQGKTPPIPNRSKNKIAFIGYRKIDG